MNIILRRTIKDLGEKDTIVQVKNGYGRNYLIPKGYAILATASAKKMLAEGLRQEQFKQEKIRKDAHAIAEKLANVKIIIGAKAGEKGKIFGAINTIQIADALKRQGITIDRKKIILEEQPKFTGNYRALLHLHKEVKVPLAFEVVSE